MKRASGEPAARATEALIGFGAPPVISRNPPERATPSPVFADTEAPTAPVNNGVIMTMPQAREALASIPHDLQPLVWAIARAFWDDGFGVGAARGPRVPPADRSPPGENTLAPLGKKKRR